MKIFITGINGFVGSYLAEDLIAHQPKSKIYGLIRHESNKNSFNAPKGKIQLIEGDLLDYKKIKEIVKSINPDWVFHLAAKLSTRFMQEADSQLFDDNIIGTLNLLKATAKHAPRAKFLLASSAAVYGNPRSKEFPIRENCQVKPIDAYGASKVCAEILCNQYYKMFGLKIIIARTFNILAPRRSKNFLENIVIPQIKSIIFKNSLPVIKTGDLSTERDFLDIRDVVRAYVELMKHGKSGETYNVCSNKAFCMKYLVNSLIALAGLKNKIKIIRDRRHVRSIDIRKSLGSNSKIKKQTLWRPKITLKKSLTDLLKNELLNEN